MNTQRRFATKERDDSNADAIEAARTFNSTTAEIKRFADETVEAIRSVKGQLLELQQKQAKQERSTEGRAFVANPWIEMAAKSDLLQPLLQQPGKAVLSTRGALKHLVKAITSAPPDGFPVAPGQAPGIHGVPSPKLRLLEVLPSAPFTSNSLLAPTVTGWTNAADYQLAEGDQKPESDVNFEGKLWPVATIAHWIQASKQVLDDAPILAVWLEWLMRMGVLAKTEHELINGVGGTNKITGLLTVATEAFVTAEHPADAIGEAAVAMGDNEPSLVIMNKADAFKIWSERTTDGAYVNGGPTSQKQSTLWDMSLVVTKSMPVGTALLLDPSAVLILDREAATVLASNSDRDNFIKNLVTLRGEIRIGMAILNPDAIAKVELPTPTP